MLVHRNGLFMRLVWLLPYWVASRLPFSIYQARVGTDYTSFFRVSFGRL